MHPELVAMVREWVRGMEPDEPLFPRIARKKTWLMVKKDLERVGIPYETHEGHRRLPRRGAALPHHRAAPVRGVDRRGQGARPARRHPADDEVHPHRHGGPGGGPGRTARTQTHHAAADWLHIGWVSGGVLGQEVSPDVSERTGNVRPRNEQTPARPGLASSVVANCHQLAVCGRSGGGGNCTRVPRSFNAGLYVRSRSFDCRPGGPDRQGPFRLIPS